MKILIWDYNGTILDDVKLTWDVENELLRERHMPELSFAAYRRSFCFPIIDFYDKLGYDFSKESYADVSDEFQRLYQERFGEARLMLGFTEKVSEAIAKGYRNVILSAAPQADLVKQCVDLGIDRYFQEILGSGDNFGSSKAKRAVTWLQKKGYDPSACMFLGDTVHDMETAVSMGIDNYLLVADGHSDYETLKESTDKVVHSLAEVKL